MSPPHPVINPNTGNSNDTCGNGGMVLTWDNGLNAFVDVPAVSADGEPLDACQGCATNDQASASFDLGNLADSVILRYIAL